MHTRFDDELDDLYFSLADMANCTQKAVHLISDAFLDKKKDVMKEAEDYAENIKRMHHQLEGLCMHLLLRRQPVAGDLRRISSIMKIISDLERIGDNSADVAEVLFYCSESKLLEEAHLVDMCAAVETMLAEAVYAYLTKDVAKAQKAVKEDDIVDDYFRNAKQYLTVTIKNGEPGSEAAPDLIMIAKYLERMGDHAASIANWMLEENVLRETN